MHETVKECRALVMRSLPQLMALSELETSARPDPSKWSKKEILGHLIDSASNNHQRFVRAQLSGEVKLPSYEQDAWVKTQGYQAESWEDLVQLWRLYNLHLLHVLETMPAEKLTSTCFIGEDPPVTIESLAREYQLHLKHHLDQILSYPTASPPTAR